MHEIMLGRRNPMERKVGNCYAVPVVVARRKHLNETVRSLRFCPCAQELTVNGIGSGAKGRRIDQVMDKPIANPLAFLPARPIAPCIIGAL